MSEYRSVLRRTAALTATAVALVTVLAGCSAAPGTAADTGTPVEGGTLTYLITEATVTLDPAVSPGSATALMTRNIFDSLVVQTEPGVFEPWLATSWTVSPDGTVYTFALRDDVTFQDGTPLTADAVTATLDHLVDPSTKSQNTARVSAYRSSRAIDPHTVEITLSQPFRPFLDALSSPALGIQSPTALALPADQYKPVGTGPFSYVSWDQQKTLVLDRNPNYDSSPTGSAHQGPAYLEHLRFDLVTEDTTRLGALTSGQAQAIEDVPASSVATLTSTDGFQVQTASSPGVPYSLYLNSSGGLTSDRRIRQALSAAIDVPTIVQSVYFGTYQPATNILAPATADYDASASDVLQKYDPAQAAALLDAAGWTQRDADGYRAKDGRTLELVWPIIGGADRAGRALVGQAIQDQAKQAGIKISRPVVDVPTALARAASGDYAIWDGANERADPDILRDFFGSDRTFANGGANLSRVDSPELDAWLQEGLTTSDPDVASKAYANVQRTVLEQAYALPVFIAQYTLGATTALHGIVFSAPTAQPLFYDAWLSE
jgi:peptide/nickel transport system substrate-binding protein